MSGVKNKKNSRTPIPAQSKHKLMKQRLKLKESVDVLGGHSQTHVDDIIQDGEAAVSGALGDKDNVADEEQGENADKASKNNNFNRSSPMKLVRLCKGMTVEQRTVISNAEFGQLLGMKISKLNPELCIYLMGASTHILVNLILGTEGGFLLQLRLLWVMGVPWGDTPMAYHLDVNATTPMLSMFGITAGKQPTLAVVEKELGPSYPADEIYLRKFMIFLICSVFAPTTGIAVSPRCYPSLINIDALHKLNWLKFIVATLIQKKNWFKPCMPYLMVMYVDSLETTGINVRHTGTRICVWMNQMIIEVVDLDTNCDGSFGKLPPKECYRNRPTMFST